MKLHVKVTADHIKYGGRFSCHDCPVALAFHDLGYPHAIVRGEEVAPFQFTAQGIALPDIARTFIRDFDHGYPVEPFEFDIETWLQSGCFQ